MKNPNSKLIKPALISVNPKRIISLHEASATLYWKNLYSKGQFYKIPPIPVMISPPDLRDIGDYMNYNGHHRKASALEVGIEPQCFLIATDNDIRYLAENCESYPELIEGLPHNFEAHYDHTCDTARYFQALNEIKAGKMPKKRPIKNVNIQKILKLFIPCFDSL